MPASEGAIDVRRRTSGAGADPRREVSAVGEARTAGRGKAASGPRTARGAREPSAGAQVLVRILHAPAEHGDAELVRLLADVRGRLAERHVAMFRSAGASDVRIETGRGGASFGERLATLRDEARAFAARDVGLVVLGSGSVPLMTPGDAARFLATAASGERQALANNAYSADIVAIGRAAELPDPPSLPSDNAVPRWLAERAGWEVRDLRRVTRLGFDIDSPLDAALAGLITTDVESQFEPLRVRLARLRIVIQDPRGELVVTGRTSATILRTLETRAACRVRAIVEERGLRASSRLALGAAESAAMVVGDHRPVPARAAAPPGQLRLPGSPPRSLLGLLLDRAGPAAIGSILSELGDGALVDTRVLMAHRFGADERAWPSPADRFASDLLADAPIEDEWLRTLTRAAADAPIPIVLGGHSLVGPGLGLALGLRTRTPAAEDRPGRS